ncbi:HAD family hydrolase [Streptomyces vinaceus]|uniref:HAD family hydrolase n=1 Tax=Streptomyces vinaceus TaxID=1960 RepID=UPI00167805E2|nr:HAD family phosphatase [Streptomyces vinaceus]GHE50867.1 hypothetical protein GCM10017778_38640 [Streptomyces vinaceus]
MNYGLHQDLPNEEVWITYRRPRPPQRLPCGNDQAGRARDIRLRRRPRRDTERLAVRLQVELGAELGWPLTEDEVVERFIGRSEESIVGQIAERLGVQSARLWWKLLIQRHRDAVDLALEPVAGLPEALEGIAALALATCVASSGSHEKILRAARRMGVDPVACVVVEDSGPGVRAARELLATR